MADAEHLAQAGVVAAEADECSRWIMACLTLWVGVLLVCISFLVDRDADSIMQLLAVLPLCLGIFLCIHFVFLLLELCGGIYINPWRRLADETA
jgi:peptidoglycan/LPS O-acetylase OafA/YrhL